VEVIHTTLAICFIPFAICLAIYAYLFRVHIIEHIIKDVAFVCPTLVLHVSFPKVLGRFGWGLVREVDRKF
jgi:hypothetical protein